MSHSIVREKIGHNISFTGKIAFFCQKFAFSTSQVLKNCSYNFYSNFQKNLWTLLNCSVRFVKLDTTRKNRPQKFFHWQVCLFFRKFVFATTSQVFQKLSNNFETNCRNTCWTLKNRPVRFVTLDNTKKTGRNIFFTANIAFFQKFVHSTTS